MRAWRKAALPASRARPNAERRFFIVRFETDRACLAPAAMGPADSFVDRQQHDVGTGGLFDTPTLLGLSETAPYFHDGRAGSIAAVIDHFDASFRLELSESEHADLVAYVEAIGAIDRAVAPVTLVRELEAIDRLRWALGEAVKRKHFDDAALIIQVSRRRIGELHARYGREHQEMARQALIVWSRALQGLGRNIEATDSQAAHFAFLAYTSAFLGNDANHS